MPPRWDFHVHLSLKATSIRQLQCRPVPLKGNLHHKQAVITLSYGFIAYKLSLNYDRKMLMLCTECTISQKRKQQSTKKSLNCLKYPHQNLFFLISTVQNETRQKGFLMWGESWAYSSWWIFQVIFSTQVKGKTIKLFRLAGWCYIYQNRNICSSHNLTAAMFISFACTKNGGFLGTRCVYNLVSTWWKKG